MTYIEFRKKLKQWRITVKDFSNIIGFSKNTNISSGWSKNGLPHWVPTLMETLELLSIEQREKFFTEKLGEK
jgi:hypothetical protein